MPDFSVVVPAYREAPRIAACVRALSAACAATGRPWEIVMAVEQSPDDTLALAREAAKGNACVRVLDLPAHRGKGHAVRAGVLAAQGDIVFFTDADLSADLAALADFLGVFAKNPACAGVVGVRTRRTGRPPLLRRLFSRCFHALVRLLTGLPHADTQCGFKAFRAAPARELAERQREDGYAFDIEWLLHAQSQGWDVIERPLVWRDRPHSQISLPRDGLRLLCDTLRLRRRAQSR